ncbi:MAG: cyclic nucleotide-binding domain-containing protein [Deltaproteobacteria bacterium]|nr:cyclic nucleotide-binding domain-containing protein [Deltaproteobacteria bacterium]MBW2306665.1 cyclic nucleotide-binding domain-containing protein [Deltaproteobacteria bacterium]
MEQTIKDVICNLSPRIRLFHTMTDEEFGLVCPYFDLLSFPAGTYIFQEGEFGDWMGIIISGKLEVQKSTTFPGKHLIMAYMSKGSVIGEMAVIEEQHRSSSVYTMENTELLILKKDQLEEIIRSHPAIGAKLLKEIAWILSRRLRQLGERVKVIV